MAGRARQREGALLAGTDRVGGGEGDIRRCAGGAPCALHDRRAGIEHEGAEPRLDIGRTPRIEPACRPARRQRRMRIYAISRLPFPERFAEKADKIGIVDAQDHVVAECRWRQDRPELALFQPRTHSFCALRPFDGGREPARLRILRREHVRGGRVSRKFSSSQPATGSRQPQSRRQRTSAARSCVRPGSSSRARFRTARWFRAVPRAARSHRSDRRASPSHRS